MTETVAQPWLDRSLSADARASLLVEALTLDEMIRLVHGPMPRLMETPPEGAAMGAGYIYGIERLGIPALNETDASLGVANLRQAPGDGATGLPSGLGLASTWDPKLARAAGAMVGAEARNKGFNVLLGGGVNLTREPRCGRNFEYLGEDPLLAGVLAGEAIAGAQSNNIVCTIKHFALNDQETCRHVVDARIDEGPLRESDLLAFQIAIERGDPGSVMCAYNKLNGDWTGENEFLLTQVLRRDWDWRGWVMSDWGAVHSTAKAALAGMDQESGEQLDKQVYFGEPLKAAVESGEVPFERLCEMVHRILRTLIDKGVFDNPVVPGPTAAEANARTSQDAAEAGCVLLKNDGILPLARTLRRIAVIGGHADVGVLSGGGSSQVIPVGGPALSLKVAGMAGSFASIVYHPSSPLLALRAQAPQTEVVFHDGAEAAGARDLAASCDAVIVFATQWTTEAEDLPDLDLPDGQDELIFAVAAAGKPTIVVLETGTPVLMPWLGEVSAVLEAWYPGTRGGEAIAALLYGEVNPLGRLPMSFPASLDELVRPQIPGMIFGPPVEGQTIPTTRPDVQQHKGRFSVEHPEGAAVGYRWYAREGSRPLFPFGFGLGYTTFGYSDLQVSGGETLTVSLTVTNTGQRSGIDTPQVYLLTRDAEGRNVQRLIGWEKAALAPGESRRVQITADRRLLATFDAEARLWKIPAGRVAVGAGSSAQDLPLKATAELDAGTLAP